MVEGLSADSSEIIEDSFVEVLSVDRLEGNEETLVVEGLNADVSRVIEDSLVVERLNIDGLEDNEVSLVEGLSVDRSKGNEDSLVEGVNVDRADGTKSVKVDVGDTACPWQLPPVIETSSIAKSLQNKDPRIPSNVT